MAAGDYIRHVANSEQAVDGFITVSLPSGAAAGNLLIGIAGRNSGNVIVDQAGWTLIGGNAAGAAMGAKWFYKIAAGGETDFTCDIRPSTSGAIVAVIAEYEGPFAASPLNQSNEDETNINNATALSQPTGNITTTVADALLLGMILADVQASITDGRTYDPTSFVEDFFPTIASTAHCVGWLASRVVAATGTYGMTFTSTDTGTAMYGAIAAFEMPAAGTPFFTRLGGRLV